MALDMSTIPQNSLHVLVSTALPCDAITRALSIPSAPCMLPAALCLQRQSSWIDRRARGFCIASYMMCMASLKTAAVPPFPSYVASRSPCICHSPPPHICPLFALPYGYAANKLDSHTLPALPRYSWARRLYHVPSPNHTSQTTFVVACGGTTREEATFLGRSRDLHQ